MDKIEIGDETYITPTHAQTRVRGGGQAGGRAWLAKIKGTDSEYGLARTFLKKEPNTSKSGKSGTIAWTIPGDGIYEYRNFASSSTGNAEGFVSIKGPEIEELSKRKVLAIMEDLEGPRITVRCPNCNAQYDEKEVHIDNIEEGLRREDIVSFKCPKCGKPARSNRIG